MQTPKKASERGTTPAKRPFLAGGQESKKGTPSWFVLSPMESQSFKRMVAIPRTKGDSPRNKKDSRYRDLVSDQYPQYLLPPNALASVRIALLAQGLENDQSAMPGEIFPSAHLKGIIDNLPVSFGVYAVSDNTCLWTIRKDRTCLKRLYQQMMCLCLSPTMLPSLSEAQVDAAFAGDRHALAEYLNGVLQANLTDLAELVVCEFLSTQVWVKKSVRMRRRKLE